MRKSSGPRTAHPITVPFPLTSFPPLHYCICRSSARTYWFPSCIVPAELSCLDIPRRLSTELPAVGTNPVVTFTHPLQVPPPADRPDVPSTNRIMASNTFRDSVNSLGWSRRDPDLPVRTNDNSSTPFLSRLQSWNPFGGDGYVQLPTHEAPGAPLPAPSRREEEDGFFACRSPAHDRVPVAPPL